MAGCLVPHEKVDESYNAGFSMYVAAWPLLKNYPDRIFRAAFSARGCSLSSMAAEPKDQYSDIEGGLGWWRVTRFATETPKFIMGGVALSISSSGRTVRERARVATGRIRPDTMPLPNSAAWVLWPPDGLNLKQERQASCSARIFAAAVDVS